MAMYHFVCSQIDAAIDSMSGILNCAIHARRIASAGFSNPLRASPRWPKLAKMMNLPGTA